VHGPKDLFEGPVKYMNPDGQGGLHEIRKNRRLEESV
jgi:hypothetical protein